MRPLLASLAVLAAAAPAVAQGRSPVAERSDHFKIFTACFDKALKQTPTVSQHVNGVTIWESRAEVDYVKCRVGEDATLEKGDGDTIVSHPAAYIEADYKKESYFNTESYFFSGDRLRITPASFYGIGGDKVPSTVPEGDSLFFNVTLHADGGADEVKFIEADTAGYQITRTDNAFARIVVNELGPRLSAVRALRPN